MLLLALLLLAACGKKLDPYYPDELLPGPVREFRLTQEGESLVLSWIFPQKDRLGQPLTQLSGFRLERCETKGVEPSKGCLPEFRFLADIDLTYPQAGRVQGERVVYQDLNLVPDRRYTYRVAAYGTGRHPGVWSRELSHAWGVLPRAPGTLKAEAGDRQVSLSWSPVDRLQDGSSLKDLAGYEVYRRVKEGEYFRITPKPISETGYQDVAVKNDAAYTYIVRAVRRLGPDLLASGNSPPAAATPEDLTPPPPLLNLVAVPTAKGVELRWDESPAPDLAGYRVYRRMGSEARFTRLTPTLLTKPYFVDPLGRQRGTFIYYATAVDNSRRANESLPSEEAEVRF